MFDKEYIFSGRHADMVRKLTAQFDNENNIKIFPRNIDVYIMAPIIGFLYGRKSPIDTNNDITTKIFPEQLIKESAILKYNYQLIMLSDGRTNSFDERIDKAFRNYGNKDNLTDEQEFNEFALGGVEILYEKIIMNSTTNEDYIKNLYDFMEEFDSRFNEVVSTDKIIDLCHLAKS